MKIVVLGVGKVGDILVKNLAKENHDIVVIDQNSEIVNKIVNRYDVKGIIGSGIERNVLTDAEVSTADLFIACTSRDEINVLTCVLAKKLGVERTVARVRDPELFKEMGNMTEVFGLDLVFNPEYRTAMEIAQILKFPSAKNVESFANGRALMIEFPILKGNPIIGKSLVEVAEYGYKILFAMVERDDEIIIPRGDYVVQENDNVHIIATESEMTAFCKKLKIFKPRSKSVFVVGGGRVCYYLAKELLNSNTSVKIMESDLERCKFLSEALPKADVVCADATDQHSLEEENIKNTDACAVLTGSDEANVIVSLFAIKNKVQKVITKVVNDNVIDMVEDLGLDSIVSPKTVIANHILRYVRATNVLASDSINNLYKLNEKTEALEFTVADGFLYSGKKLKDLRLKRNTLIGGIVRGNDFILPSGETEFIVGDRVIVVTEKNQISDFLEIFR
ncbi:MAG: Trk system potassium transporter TrkA [Clostridia bacterium]|nr:Trk system potassium transporter TrkA [Clostridia bacterium]